MTFAGLVRGASFFVDANIFVFHFQPHTLFGSSCTSLLKRVELRELSGYTSTLVLGEVAHRLMTLEASARFGWPTKIVDRLKQNPATVQQLVHFRPALQKIPQMGIQVLTIATPLVDAAAGLSQSTGLLTNDAMVVAVLRSEARQGSRSPTHPRHRLCNAERWGDGWLGQNAPGHWPREPCGAAPRPPQPPLGSIRAC